MVICCWCGSVRPSVQCILFICKYKGQIHSWSDTGKAMKLWELGLSRSLNMINISLGIPDCTMCLFEGCQMHCYIYISIKTTVISIILMPRQKYIDFFHSFFWSSIFLYILFQRSPVCVSTFLYFSVQGKLSSEHVSAHWRWTLSFDTWPIFSSFFTQIFRSTTK